MPIAITYGMFIRLRHSRTGALLSSLAQNYVHLGTSHQQIVGGGSRKDAQSIWLVKPAHDNQGNHLDGQPVNHGSIIRLEHLATHKNLHSHQTPAPMTGPEQWEVTAFSHQAEGVGDANDDWIVRLDAPGPWRTGDVLRLRHVLTNRVLHSHGIADPNRTAGLYEVTTVANGDLNDLFVCSEVDLPQNDEVLAESLPPGSPAPGGGLVERFKQHWFIAMLVYSGFLVAVAWTAFDQSLLKIAERDLASVRESREQALERLKVSADEASALRLELTEAHKTLGHRDTEIAALQRQLNGIPRRRLTTAQVQSLAKLLEGQPTGAIGVVYHRGDPVGDGLSGDIHRALEKAGFKSWSGFYDEFTPERGVWLEIPESSYRPELVKKLQEAFRTVDIELQLKINEAAKADSSDLLIHITN